MPIYIPTFQQYQREFTAYIRDPINQPRPQDVVAKRMDVYKEIVFNNLFESVSACFPVAKKVMGKRRWLKLTHDFLRDHSANTPIFRKIPEEFLNYLSQVTFSDQVKLPPYLASLCHYEWIELLVSTIVDSTNNVAADDMSIYPTGNLLKHRPVFNPTIQLLNYDYAVHKISPRHKPKEKSNTQLLVYRNAEFEVKFVELNPITFKLIELLHEEKMNCEQALTIILDEINHPHPESMIQFGLAILEDLRMQGIILGIYNN
jgi:hypothetical protein